ncbi:hypothetical protein DH2020_025802 [Rehmannia glutinosa]|uniref:DNA endonuclease activator Ctp1 C-terminal domain-containing protein n=1 Tax=Rehmannia glutinosa TaxID=99300 RepID=A0ABR0W2A1_REHGL
MNNEQLLDKYEKENRHLMAEVKSLVNRADELRKELGKKNLELEEVRKLQMQLLQQNDSLNFERIKRGKALEEFEERKLLLDKQKGLENEVYKLQQSVSERSKESSAGMELHGKLLQQIEVKDSEIAAERRKRKDVIAAYKKLKSQYNYLLKKHSLTQESMLPLDKMDDESEIIRHNQIPVTSRVLENNKVSGIANDVTKPADEQEVLEDNKGVVSIQRASPVSPSTSNINIAPKWPSSTRSCPPVGAKQNLGRATKEDIPDFPKTGPINMSIDNSDDSTQDMNADDGPQKLHMSPPKVGPSGKNSNGDKQNIRCEHHDGVSRHRYRYAPPLTPDGFWNIGFESEM